MKKLDNHSKIVLAIVGIVVVFGIFILILNLPKPAEIKVGRASQITITGEGKQGFPGFRVTSKCSGTVTVERYGSEPPACPPKTFRVYAEIFVEILSGTLGGQTVTPGCGDACVKDILEKACKMLKQDLGGDKLPELEKQCENYCLHDGTDPSDPQKSWGDNTKEKCPHKDKFTPSDTPEKTCEDIKDTSSGIRIGVKVRCRWYGDCLCKKPPETSAIQGGDGQYATTTETTSTSTEAIG